MLKTENRLKKPADFSQVLKEGQRFKARYALFAYRPTTKPLRVGIVVSKKVSKKAVERNHLRRVFYHLFWHLIKDQSATGDVVVVVNRHPEQTVFAALENDVKQWSDKFLPA